MVRVSVSVRVRCFPDRVRVRVRVTVRHRSVYRNRLCDRGLTLPISITLTGVCIWIGSGTEVE